MSAGVSDQRMKGQGNQEHIESGGGSGETDFESWRHQSGGGGPSVNSSSGGGHTTAYGGGAGAAQISSQTADPYGAAAGYYGSAAAGTAFPYQAFGVSDGTWSNGTDPMTFLGGYTHDTYGVDAFGQPSTFNYFPGNGDYSTWGSHNQQRKAHYDDYYRTDAQAQSMYTQNPGLGIPESGLSLKAMEQGMQNLNLDMSNSLHGSHMLQNPGMGQIITSSNLICNKDKDSLTRQQDGLSHKDNLGLSHAATSSSAPKKMTWASIASQPAKPQVSTQSTSLKKKGPGMPPPPMIPGKHNMDIGTWDTAKNGPSIPPPPLPVQPVAPSPVPVPTPTPIPPSAPTHKQQQQNSAVSSPPNMNVRPAWQQSPPQNQTVQQNQSMPSLRPSINMTRNMVQPMQNQMQQPSNHTFPSQHQQQVMMQHMSSSLGMPPHVGMHPMGALQGGPGAGQHIMTQQPPSMPLVPHPVLDELRGKNNYNPPEFDLTAPNARFFVIKSYSEDDIHRSIKYEIWCSTEHGNKRLDQAFREREKVTGGMVYLFFSVNGSGHFCGMAQMVSPVDYSSNSSVWSQNKWKGQFKVRWIYVKDVPNVQLRHIRLENNENKPVTNSRDTQEVPHPKGQQVLRILHSYRHSTSIFDDFIHYEKRQEEEDSRKVPVSQEMQHGNYEHKIHGADYGNEQKGHHQASGYNKQHGGMRDHQNNSNSYRERGGNDMHGGYHDNQRIDSRDNHRMDSRDNHRNDPRDNHRVEPRENHRMDNRDSHRMESRENHRMDSRDNHRMDTRENQRIDGRDHYRDGGRGGSHREQGHESHGGHRMHHGMHPKDRDSGNRGRGRGRN